MIVKQRAFIAHKNGGLVADYRYDGSLSQTVPYQYMQDKSVVNLPVNANRLNDMPVWDSTAVPPENYGNDICTIEYADVEVMNFYVHSLPLSDVKTKIHKGTGTADDPWVCLYWAYREINCILGKISCGTPPTIYIHISGVLDYTYNDLLVVDTYLHDGIYGTAEFVLDFQDCTEVSASIRAYGNCLCIMNVSFNLSLYSTEDTSKLEDNILPARFIKNCNIKIQTNTPIEVFLALSTPEPDKWGALIDTNIELVSTAELSSFWDPLRSQCDLEIEYTICSNCNIVAVNFSVDCYGGVLYTSTANISQYGVLSLHLLYKSDITISDTAYFNWGGGYTHGYFLYGSKIVVDNPMGLDEYGSFFITNCDITASSRLLGIIYAFHNSKLSIVTANYDALFQGYRIITIGNSISNSTIDVQFTGLLENVMHAIVIDGDDGTCYNNKFNFDGTIEVLDDHSAVGDVVTFSGDGNLLVDSSITASINVIGNYYGISWCGINDRDSVQNCSIWNGLCVEGEGAKEDYQECVEEYGADRCKRYCEIYKCD